VEWCKWQFHSPVGSFLFELSDAEVIPIVLSLGVNLAPSICKVVVRDDDDNSIHQFGTAL
jgi:hypothetical protein